MAIPDYESLMLPLLRAVASAESMTLGDVAGRLADEFGLSEEERERLLPSGQYPMFRSRVGWAKTYLKQAGLLSQPKRGVMTITAEGRRLLSERPQGIDNRTLARYPTFREFMSRSGVRVGNASVAPLAEAQRPAVTSMSPQEQIEGAASELRATLKSELLEAVGSASAEFFERLVVQLLLKMGYGGSRAEAGQAVGRTGDGGIDGVINEDRLGLDSIYLQAKRWRGTVGEPELRNFLGALVGRGAAKGVIITTGGFTEQARAFAARSLQQRIVLIDGDRLGDLLIEHDLGVSRVSTYEIKRLDADYFNDE